MGLGDLRKSSRTEEQLENEIYILKETSCRLSKRLVLIENFIKNKFVDEFPLKPRYSTRWTKNVTPSSNFKKSGVTAPISRLPASASSPSGLNRSRPIRKTDINEGFLLDSEEPAIDWARNSSRASEDRSLPELQDNSRNKFTENKLNGSSSVGAEVEIEHHDNEDRSSDDDDNSKDMDYNPPDDHPPCPSPGYEVGIDKTDEDAMNWLNGVEELGPDTDTDDESSKNKDTRKWDQVRKAASQPPRKRKIYATCNICKRVFNGPCAPTNLKRHMDCHSAIRKYKCKLCDKTYQHERSLEVHMSRIHEFEKYAVHLCQYCGKKFVEKRDKLKHERVHTGEKPYVCEICGFSFAQEAHLVRHKRTHLPEKDDLCTECGKAFPSNQHLKSHTQNCKPISILLELGIEKTDEEAMNCLNGEDELGPGTDTDDESPKNKVTRKWDRVRKAASQPPRKRKIYATCNICKRVFNGPYAPTTLKRHMDCHSAIRKYKCKLCDKTYQHERSLEVHMSRIHEFEKYAVHLCQYCGKKFVIKRDKLIHERVHTGEKPYVCEICGFGFAQEAGLVSHKRTHLPEKDVLCTECGKVFPSNQHLKSHTKNFHEGEFGPAGKKLKTMVCQICNAAFSNSGGLKIHTYREHGGKSRSTQPKAQSIVTLQEENACLSKETTEAVNSILPE